MRGVALLKQGLTEEAYESFRRAVALRPTNPIVGRKLAEVCVTLGKWEEAKAALETLVEYWPMYPSGYAALARVNIHLGEWDEAARCVDTARRLTPNDPALQAIQQELPNTSTSSGPKSNDRIRDVVIHCTFSSPDGSSGS